MLRSFPSFCCCASAALALAAGNAKAALYFSGDGTTDSMPLGWTTGATLVWDDRVTQSLDMLVALDPHPHHPRGYSWRSWEYAPEELRDIVSRIMNPPDTSDVVVCHAAGSWQPLVPDLPDHSSAEAPDPPAGTSEADIHAEYPNGYNFSVPEPGTAMLLGLGAVALVRRRRVPAGR